MGVVTYVEYAIYKYFLNLIFAGKTTKSRTMGVVTYVESEIYKYFLNLIF